MRQRGEAEQGSVMVFALGVVVMVTTLGTSFLARSLSEDRLQSRSLVRQEAFYLAEAAVDQALLNLRTADTSDDVTTGTLLTGAYQIDTPMTQLTATRWLITTRGTSDAELRRMEAVVDLIPQSIFQYALFGAQQVEVSGNAFTDSYNSSLGAYDEDEALHNGDVGTNSTNNGGISVSGNIFVDGQLVVGPGVPDPEALVSGFDPAFVTGGTDPPTDTQDVAAASATFPMPVVSVPGHLTCNDYTVNGNTTVSLAPGVYCYRNLTIEGNADLTASGDVTIYITGELNARGNTVVGVPDDPSQMLFLMTASSSATLEQSIEGNNTFYGAIYGPQATIDIRGNATIFGAVVAQNIEVSGNATIHYDENLANFTNVSNTFQTAVISWRELN